MNFNPVQGGLWLEIPSTAVAAERTATGAPYWVGPWTLVITESPSGIAPPPQGSGLTTVLVTPSSGVTVRVRLAPSADCTKIAGGCPPLESRAACRVLLKATAHDR